MENTETEIKSAGIIVAILCALLVAFTQTGCAGSTGWRVEFGVSPIKSLDNRAGLVQETEKPVSKERY